MLKNTSTPCGSNLRQDLLKLVKRTVAEILGIEVDFAWK